MVNCATLCCSSPPSTMHSLQVSVLQWCLRASSISCFDRQGPSRKVPSAVGRAGPWPRRPTRFVHAGSQRLQLFAETMSFGLRPRERDQREKIEKIRNSVLPLCRSVGVHSVRKTLKVYMPWDRCMSCMCRKYEVNLTRIEGDMAEQSPTPRALSTVLALLVRP